ncbi:MAG: 3-deoxy-7-phosphoheptulonate synthase, partial [Caulobacterales bacterium]|nr:3-deoxy-7-phosphoheptulonate synthase [Caulobacterales bacterium]
MTWTPSSWRAKPAKHLPTDYPDAAAVNAAAARIAAKPPLVFAGEARNLTQRLARVADGEA